MPLNTMCSKKWLKSVLPQAVSIMEPTRIHTPMDNRPQVRQPLAHHMQLRSPTSNDRTFSFSIHLPESFRFQFTSFL